MRGPIGNNFSRPKFPVNLRQGLYLYVLDKPALVCMYLCMYVHVYMYVIVAGCKLLVNRSHRFVSQ